MERQDWLLNVYNFVVWSGNLVFEGLIYGEI